MCDNIRVWGHAPPEKFTSSKTASETTYTNEKLQHTHITIGICIFNTWQFWGGGGGGGGNPSTYMYMYTNVYNIHTM